MSTFSLSRQPDSTLARRRDLERRLKEHISGQTRSTRGRGPWTLIYIESFRTRAEAVQHERWLKSLKNKKYILDYINSL